MQKILLDLQGGADRISTNLELSTLSHFPSPTVLTCHYLLLFLEKGELSIQIEHSIVDCHAGDALLINSNRHCQLRQYRGETLLSQSLRILPMQSSWLSSFNQRYNTLAKNEKLTRLQSQKTTHYTLFHQVAGHTQILRCMQLLALDSASQSILSTLKNQTLAHLLLCDLVDTNKDIFGILCDNEHQTLSDKIRTLILSDLSQTWTSKELAQKLCMSESTLRRKALLEFGSIVKFVHSIKMMEALRLLRRTELSITDMAVQLGFCSGAHFSSIFHREFGITPTQLRNAPQKLDTLPITQ